MKEEIWIRYDTYVLDGNGLRWVGLSPRVVDPELFPPIDYTCTPHKEARIDTERNGDGSEASGTR